MKIAIIDADLIGRKKHRFPNLACMKLSGYYKEKGDEVSLLLCYDNLGFYDQVFISKVFTDTKVPDAVLKLTNVSFGGTGFYYDKAPKLPDEVEHHMPDYHLYDDWVKEQITNGRKPAEFSYYTDYSIGFLTRGCFRHCAFCVNRNSNGAKSHSPLDEFVDPERPYICLLDDNFFGCPDWKKLLTELKKTGRPFQFKQGLDERLLTDEKCEMLFSAKTTGDIIFAFDNVADKETIVEKLKLIRKHTKKVPKFYCFCGFDRNDKWDEDFWKQDIIDLFIRIEILMEYRCLPYIMRFARYIESPYRGAYVTIARWCNQPSFFKKKSLREYADMPGNDAAKRYIEKLEAEIPQVSRFLDLKYEREN